MTDRTTQRPRQCRTSQDSDGMNHPMDVTIGLLSYRDNRLIDQLLHSLKTSSKRYRYEYLLSDNGSTDGTREMVREKYEHVKIIENGDNLGVATGRNRLFWNSSAKYTMILDADTVVHDGAIDTLIDTLEANPKAAIVVPKLVYRDGSLQLSCRPFPKLHYTLLEGTPYRKWFDWTGVPAKADMRNVPHDQLMQIDCAYGAAMLVRNRVVRSLGGFDEGYFYEYEDYDLCFRSKKAGHEVWYQPEAVVTHFYEREECGVFHPQLKNHLKSILRFQMRNLLRVSSGPVIHRRDLDGDKVPCVGVPRVGAPCERKGPSNSPTS